MRYVVSHTERTQYLCGGCCVRCSVYGVSHCRVSQQCVGDHITRARSSVCTASNRAASDCTEGGSGSDVPRHITGGVEFIKLTFKERLNNALFASFSNTFFNGDFGTRLGKVTQRLQRITQSGTCPAQQGSLNSGTAYTH